MKINDIIIETDSDDSDYQEFLQAIVKFVIDGSGRKLDKRTTELFQKHADILYAPVYRGIGLKSWDDMDEGFDFRHRDILQSDYFISASLEREVAIEKYLKPWVDSKVEKRSVLILFTIRTNSNTRAIIADNYKGEIFSLLDQDGDSPDYDSAKEDDLHTFLNYVEDEDEVLIAAPARFKVLKKERKERKWTKGIEYWEVELEQVK